MTCSSCGARNPDGAAWCSQCFAALDRDEPPPSPTTRPSGVDHPDVRTTEAGVEWCCATCGSWTSIDLFACATCGLRMGTGPVDASGPSVDPGDVTTRAALVPGAGHLAVGRRGTGAAILAIVLLWVVGGVLLTTAALDGGRD